MKIASHSRIWIFAVLVTGCASNVPVADVSSPRFHRTAAYKLGPGDRLRVLVFEEADLSGEFQIGDSGSVALPLIGTVAAQDQTVDALRAAIVTRLAGRYLKNPRVTVEVLNYRPFVILGEVIKAGSYPYTSGLTALGAVAAAQGFTYRADQRRIFIRGEGQTEERAYGTDANVSVLPGDTIRVGERFF